MTGLAEARVLLQAARDRGDTRSINVAQRAVTRAMTAELQAGVDRAKAEGRAREAGAEDRRERTRRPFWRKLWGRR